MMMQTPSTNFGTQSSNSSQVFETAMQKPCYRDYKVIGHGAFGYVFLAIDDHTKQPVAIKRSQKVGNKVSREYEISIALRGKPNIVQMINFFYTVDSKQRLIQNSVFEFCDSNLEKVNVTANEKDTYVPIEDIKRYTRGICNGLVQLHSLGISHRDLKPENILLQNGEVKICDFGSSKILDKKTHKNTPYVVSRYYRAPELILASTLYDESIDMWAVGAILFEFMGRTPLFPGDTEGLQILEQSCILGKPTSEEMQKLAQIIDPKIMTVVQNLQDLPRLDLAKLMNRNVYSEEDINQCVDLVFKMLRWCPSDRITAREALNHPFLQQNSTDSTRFNRKE
eukprot:403360846